MRFTHSRDLALVPADLLDADPVVDQPSLAPEFGIVLTNDAVSAVRKFTLDTDSTGYSRLTVSLNWGFGLSLNVFQLFRVFKLTYCLCFLVSRLGFGTRPGCLPFP